MNYYLLHTTYPILFLSVFARQLCLPVPAILFLLSGGALAGSGRLSFIALFLVAILGCLLGDLAWFEAGRLHISRVTALASLEREPTFVVTQFFVQVLFVGLGILTVKRFHDSRNHHLYGI